MDPKPLVSDSDALARAREIPVWVDRYARSRPLALILCLVMSAAVAGMFAGLSVFTALALSAHDLPLAIFVGVLDLGVGAALVWLITSHRLEALIGAVYSRTYGAEGEVAPLPQGRRSPLEVKAVLWAFFLLVAATPWLAHKLNLPPRLLQPLTALYACPFLVYVCAVMRRSGNPLLPPFPGTPLMLLWPGLYGLHALLVAAGVRPFTGIPTAGAAQVLGPLLGYGLAAGIVSHFYGRYALRRLRCAAAPEGGEGNAES